MDLIDVLRFAVAGAIGGTVGTFIGSLINEWLRKRKGGV